MGCVGLILTEELFRGLVGCVGLILTEKLFGGMCGVNPD